MTSVRDQKAGSKQPNAGRSSLSIEVCAAVAILLPATLVGCAASNGRYNPYASPGGEPTVLERAENALDVLDDVVDRFDERMERAVY